MRHIILNLAVSLDGYIEGPAGEYDWCFIDQDYGMQEFMENIDTIFFGRKSYELVLQHDKNPYPGKTKYVFSTSQETFGPEVKVISEHIEDEVQAIKQSASDKKIWLFGGTILATTLMQAGLVDELLLSVHPILLGEGKPLFTHITKTQLELIGTKHYDTGLVQLRYKIIQQ